MNKTFVICELYFFAVGSLQKDVVANHMMWGNMGPKSRL